MSFIFYLSGLRQAISQKWELHMKQDYIINRYAEKYFDLIALSVEFQY
jgi:hypothetical protein